MILALLIYLGAHTGTIAAAPAVVNALAIGALATETSARQKDEDEQCADD